MEIKKYSYDHHGYIALNEDDMNQSKGNFSIDFRVDASLMQLEIKKISYVNLIDVDNHYFDSLNIGSFKIVKVYVTLFPSLLTFVMRHCIDILEFHTLVPDHLIDTLLKDFDIIGPKVFVRRSKHAWKMILFAFKRDPSDPDLVLTGPISNLIITPLSCKSNNPYLKHPINCNESWADLDIKSNMLFNQIAEMGVAHGNIFYGKIDTDVALNTKVLGELMNVVNKKVGLKHIAIGKLWKIPNFSFLAGPLYFSNHYESQSLNQRSGEDVVVWKDVIQKYQVVDLSDLYFGDGYSNQYNSTCDWLVIHKHAVDTSLTCPKLSQILSNF